MEDKKVILGLVGHPGSGKDTVAEYLVSEYSFVHISTSDLIRKHIKENNLGELTRPVMNKVANDMREKNGPDYLVVLALKEDAPRMIISGIRTIGEAKRVKESGGSILAIKAPIEFRYKYSAERGRAGDGTFEEFKAIEEKEARGTDPNTQNVEGVTHMADYVIQNDDTLKALYKKIDAIVEKL